GSRLLGANGRAFPGSLIGRTVRGYDAAPAKFAGPGGGCDGRLAMICRSQHGAVGRGGMFVLHLRTARREVLFAGGRLFRGRGPRGDPAGAAVIADAIYRDVIV